MTRTNGAGARTRRARPSRPAGSGGDLANPALGALAADLRDLALDLQAGTYTRTTVAMLQRDVRAAVPSALGSTVSFDLDAPTGIPDEIHLLERVLEPHQVAAGLRVPLTLPQQSLRGSVLFYAGEPRAFDGVPSTWPRCSTCRRTRSTRRRRSRPAPSTPPSSRSGTSRS